MTPSGSAVALSPTAVGTMLALALGSGPVGCADPPPHGVQSWDPAPVLTAETRSLDAFIRDSLPDTFHGRVLVARGDRILLHAAYGQADREAGLPTTVSTPYDIGSITKLIVAVGVLQLVEGGAASLADSVGRWLPGVSPELRSVQLSELLTHTSGLPTYSGQDYEPVGRDEILAWLASVRLERRGDFSYSNPGFTLVALILEEISGDPLERVLEEREFGPAGMGTTGYMIPDWTVEQVAVGYAGGV